MIECDLHTHSLFSSCGNHSILELLKWAQEKKLKTIAITDHGPLLGQTVPSTFYERFQNPWNHKITLLKGMEINPLNETNTGQTDIPKRFIPYMDIILCGLHFNIPRNQGADYYTQLLINTMKSNPYIDIITHPIDQHYPLHLEDIIKAAVQYDKVLEINNSKLILNLVSNEEQLTLLKLCKHYQCKIAINSDAHCIHELGDDQAIAPLIQEIAYPRELIVNHSWESTQVFIGQRKQNKN